MSKAKITKAASGLLDSDMDDELDSVEANPQRSPDSNQENKAAPAKRGRKPASAKFTKTKAPARRVSGGAMPGRKKAAPKRKAPVKRAPLKEQTNIHDANETDEVAEFSAPVVEEADPIEDVSMEEQPPAKEPPKRKKPAARGTKAGKKPEPQPKAIEKDGEFEYTPIRSGDNGFINRLPVNDVAPKPAAGRKGAVKEIPETQTEPMDIDPSSVVEEDAIPQSVYRQTSNVGVSFKTRQPPLNRRRAGSASDTEQTGTDPALRRKLGEMTKKVDNLEMRYNNLREIGVKEAEANFEKLRIQSEAKSKAANDLIASLRKDLARQKALAQESNLLSKQITTKDNDLTTANAKVALLNTSLTEAQNENKALQAKLANVRASSVVESVHTAKTPGSAIKGKAQGRTVMVGSAEAAQAAQVAQLKEDLYSDLTGLILRGVEKGDDENVYDCIQTGRNGTLHFKISVANDTDIPYDEADIQYTPLLDANRDRDILQLLPDYLSEEITFPRSQAAHFYGRVMDTLMKKQQRLVSEDE